MPLSRCKANEGNMPTKKGKASWPRKNVNGNEMGEEEQRTG
jgi:hypothetical protein